ncbi:MAG: IS66 family transposase [Prevotella sp.]
MKKDEIISMLQQQTAFLQRQLKDALQQLGEANRKVDELLRKVSSLEELLVQKNAEEQKQHNIIKGLTKLQQNRSEKQTPPVAASSEPSPDSNDGQTAQEPKPREKTNYGARRKEHYEVEVEEEDVYPADSRFDEMKARLIDTRDVVRYILVPMRFIKKVYHVHVYAQDGTVMEGKAPLAPLQGSNYDGSFIAGIAQLRYIYSMPVERIVKYFSENGFDMDKGTAHGLLRKTETIFENLYKAMGLAVKEDDYLAGDETYHRVLVKVPGGKGSKKGYIWVVTAIHTGLVYYFYHDGSRGQDVILNYIGDYGGAFQSDGFAPYRKMAAQLTRLSCLQHVKRKFLDCDDDEEAQAIVRLINELYQMEHQHKIGVDGWTAEKNLSWRRKYAPGILKKIARSLTSWLLILRCCPSRTGIMPCTIC